MDSPRILIVDDEPSVLGLATLILQGAGYPVLTASNGREGLEAFKSSIQTINVLVSDVQMPLMGGIEMAKAIKSRKMDLNVIFISGYTPTEEITDLILEWDAQFIPKPFDLQHFKNAVQKVMVASSKV